MKKLLFAIMMLLPMMANAYDFELDGFYYNVISVSDLTLELTTDVEIKDQLNDTDNNKKYSGNVVIPETVNYKGKDWKIIKISYTFKYCYDVTSVTIPSSVSEIGECSFVGCSSLKEINLSGGIKRIGMWAFFRCGLEKLIIPNNITHVGRCVFQDCNSLKEVIIEEGDEPIYFEGGNWNFGVFADCSAIEKAIINRKYTFYDFRNETVTPPFRRCLSLKTAIFGDKVTSVPKFSFEGCTSLTDVEMSNNILSLEQSAFSGCTSLETLNIPSSVTIIADNVFKNCTSLKSTLIRNGMTSIGASAFEGCTSINSVDIVKTINNIGANAFNGCTSIKDIYVHNNVPISSVEESSFSGSSYLDAILYVPTGYIETYNNAPVWKLFFNIQEKKYGYALIYIVDGEEYKQYDMEEGESITPEAAPTKEGYTFSGWSEIPETMPAHDVTVTGTFTINKYKLTYILDGQTCKTYDVEYGSAITPEAEPMKEGYTFSGWSEIPATMPAHDVTVTGSYSINSYTLTYMVDGTEYKTISIEYGSSITAETAPTKEGYTFSGWSEIPATMPAHDVTVTGSYSINSYTLTYMVDGTEYKTISIEYGSSITAETAPTKEGYTFSGWSEIPETMPAHDVTVTGSFSINSYTITYMVDDAEYKTASVEYGSTITAETTPTKEGYTFSGWSEIPPTMPAHDVMVTGTFTINSYTLTYMVDGKEYQTVEVEYGAEIYPIGGPEKEGYTFVGWENLPEETMPAHDVTVTGTFSINSYKVTFMYGDNVLTTIEVKYGDKIELPTSLNSERYTLIEWLNVPETMPAQDITIYADYVDGINDIAADSRDAQYIQLNGMYTTELKPGLNIIRMKDGTTKKVWVK